MSGFQDGRGLGTYPTPIQRVEGLAVRAGQGGSLWVKRDDQTSPIYGGNKVRKLERLLPDARARGAECVVTVGAAGSHHVLATATFARQHGLEVEAVLLPQPRTDHAVDDLRAGLALGLRAFAATNYPEAALRVLSRLGRKRVFIPVGGSSVRGALGYVDAAREIGAQVLAGLLPEPDLAVVTLGSGGTVAGLAAGFALEQMKTRVLAVSVAQPPAFNAWFARRLAERCVSAASGKAKPGDAAARIDEDRRWLGKGYGHATPEGDRATELAPAHGLTLDPTYTAKTFAAALAAVEEGRAKHILYVHTLSSAPMAPLLRGAGPESELAPALRRLFL